MRKSCCMHILIQCMKQVITNPIDKAIKEYKQLDISGYSQIR